MNSTLEKMVERLSSSPAFLAYRLKQYTRQSGKAWDSIAAELNISPDQLGKLALCRPPRAKPMFVQDVGTMAASVGMPVSVLANFLRRLEMLGSYDAGSASVHIREAE